jgi:hypothetical protein
VRGEELERGYVRVRIKCWLCGRDTLGWKIEMERKSVEVERGGKEEIEGRIRQRKGCGRNRGEGICRMSGKGTGDGTEVRRTLPVRTGMLCSEPLGRHGRTLCRHRHRSSMGLNGTEWGNTD